MTEESGQGLRWWVGREEGIYVEERERGYHGEVGFATETEALLFAINCCDDHIQTHRGSRKGHAARLRAIKRKAARRAIKRKAARL